MKKILVVLLCMMMAVGMIACGGKENEKKSEPAENEDAVKAEKNVGTEENELNEEEKTESDMLSEIGYWYLDVWNDLWDFHSYRETGKDRNLADIDIEFAYKEFKKAYEKKSEYHDYINGLSDEFSNVKEHWNKMNEQMELLYADLEKNGVQQGAPALNLDLLNQYATAFGNDLYELGI